MNQGGRSGVPQWRSLRAEPVLITILAVVVIVAVAFWANAMVTPVSRKGEPTATIAPQASVTASATPTPTPSATPTSGAGTATMDSSGTFSPAAVDIAAASSTGTLTRVALQVETSAGLKANEIATQVADILNDKRSWTGTGKVRFAMVADIAKADVLISVSSPKTAAKACTLSSGSCVDTNVIVLDALSLKNPPATYPDATSWEQYLVNHAFGTWLKKKPATCTKPGGPAPVMMPQGEDLAGCTANPWPNP